MLIKLHYGYHDFGDFPWTFRLKRLLYTRSRLSNERPGLLFDFATAWLVQNKILLPAASKLTRLIGEIRERASRRLWRYEKIQSLSVDQPLQTLLSDIPDCVAWRFPG